MKKNIITKISAMLLAMTMIISLTVSASAAVPIQVFIDGDQVTFDVSPIKENGRTLVPMRQIFEAMNCTVEWNKEKQAAIVATEFLMGLEIKPGLHYFTQYWIDTDNYDASKPITQQPRTSESNIPLDVPAKVVSGRTMVPVRLIAESMGYEVNWNKLNQAVEITSEGFDGVASTSNDTTVSVPVNPSAPPSSTSNTNDVAKYIIGTWKFDDDVGGMSGTIPGEKFKVTATAFNDTKYKVLSVESYEDIYFVYIQETINTDPLITLERTLIIDMTRGWMVNCETGYEDWQYGPFARKIA